MKTLIVCGATGRMGKAIGDLAEESGRWKEVFRADRHNGLESVIAKGDVVIDFTLPEGTEKHLQIAIQNKKPIVIGTTGLSTEQQEKIKRGAKEIPIIYAPNMSVGVNVLFRLIEEAAKGLGPEYDVAIEETHHIHKKDKPSGTAKAMGAIVEKILGEVPPIESIREGEVVGEHTIIFGSSFEHLAIYHKAFDRKVFADGALRAAHWLFQKKPGLYTMMDVLGLAS